MAAWHAQVSLARFAVEYTHRCIYLMMISYCREFTMLFGKEVLLFSYVWKSCLEHVPGFFICLQYLKVLQISLSAEKLSVPLFLCSALTWPPEFATLHHKGQQSSFLPCGISAVLMRGWILHCKAEAYCLQAKKVSLGWYGSAPVPELTCSIFRPWRMPSTAYGRYRDIASRTVSIWHINIIKPFSMRAAVCLLSTGIDKNYI